ncbi:MAG: G8 domain-containing protein, partial [Paracoccaceae bacterium]
WNPNENVDVLEYAYGGISASGFNASPGAIWEPERVGWINPEGSIVGKMEYKTSNSESNREDFIISRSDNGARILFGSDAQGQSSRGQLNVDGSGDVEYIVSYPGNLPDEIEIEFFDLPQGATAYYRFEGLPGDVVVQDATRYDNLAQVRAADETAWFRDSNGDFVVKIYADRFNQRLAPRAETGTAQHQPYTDEFTIVIDARGSARPSGNRNPIDAPDDYFGPATPGPLPERAESTSDTALIGAGDMRWSDSSAWDREVPGADDIVVIGQGMRVVLDTDAVVKAIIVNGGELVVEDSQDLALAADWILVINGGIFQVGTEDTPFQHDFDLTLEGDDPGNDIDVGALVGSSAANIVRAIGGTYANDNIEGTERGETVAALTGNDIVSTGAGDDHVDLGWGDDSADGGAGEDTLSFASLAPPSLEINGLTFGATVDLALQGSAQNTGHGTDTFVNFEHLQGSEFNDNLLGNAGANRIDGAGGRDLLKGEAGEDTLLGGGGYDVLDGGTGADTLFGGTTGEAAIEMDIVAYFGASGPLIFNFGSSLSEIDAGSSAEILQDTIGSDIEGFAGASDFSNTFNAENITTITAFLGGSQSDTFLGGSGTDQLLGAADDDEIHGNDGSDALIGESGNDDLYGGAGADAFFFDGNNEGHDTIHDLELGLDAVFISKGVLTELVFTETDADGNGVSDTLVTMLGGGGDQSITIIDLDAATVEAQANISF